MKTRVIFLSLIILTFILLGFVINGCDANLVSPDETASPGNLELVKLSEGRIQFNWSYNYPEDDTVYYYIGHFNGRFWDNLYEITEDEFLVDNIPTNDSLIYAYNVYAVNQTSEITSPTSAIIAYMSEYANPSDLEIEQLSQEEVKLIWDDHSVGEDGFYLSKKIGDESWQNKYRTLPENTTEFTDMAEMYQEVQYKISAFKGITSSDEIEAAIVATLNHPTELTATTIDVQKVRLNWLDNSDAEAGFIIDRKKGNLDWVINYAVVDSNTTTFVDDIMEPCGTFQYRVKAFNGDFFSLDSEEVSINIFLNLVGSVETSGSSQDVFISESTNWYAIVADFYSGLTIIDCVDPSNPEEQAYNQEGLPDRTFSVFVKDNTAYLTTHTGLEEHGWLYKVDLSTILPYHNLDFPPVLNISGAYPITGNENDTYTPYDIFVQGDYAYIADGENGIEVVYVSTSNPGFIANCPTNGIARGIYVEDLTAYVASGLGGVDVVDISDPYNPVVTQNYPTSGISVDVKEYNGHLYVADGENGLKIINLSTNTVQIVETGGFVNSVYAQGQDRLQEDHVYVLDKEQGLFVVDISNIDSPYILGHYEMDSDPRYLDKFFQSSYVYIADESGIKIIQIAP